MPPPLPRPNWRPRHYLCHRGADPLIVQEIAGYFRQRRDVIVQDGDGLSLSFPEFRRLALQHLKIGCNSLIVLLNDKFPGAAYRHTLGAVMSKPQKELSAFNSIYVIRIDDCDYESSLPPWADLADAETPEERREILLRSDRTLCGQSLR
jgi:hypothetical protein